ncbi:uncharacterized protein LOC128208770 [Mya arenaria]|uniref:uncharacterized protein LOC128208770 n=1 Tax=Mya arenaria TaxID=6604 RepID=UPI0022DEB0EF|nr:uncharacterized protein LOC128208770 [Mya arenaria]
MYTLFNLVRLISVKNEINPVTIENFAWRQHGESSLLALACSNGFIILRHCNSGSQPLVKQLPWPPDHPIRSMCFDPTVTWLLVLTENGNLFIIPALPMLDPSVQVNHQWSVDDVTIVTCLTPRALPTHCVWWQTLDGRHIAIVATTVGELLYVDLERGCQVAERVVDEHIRSTELVQDDQQTLTSLLVTGKTGKQWKLLLEKKWPLVNTMESEVALELGYDNIDGKSLPLRSILDRHVENQEERYPPELLSQFARSVTLTSQYARGRHLVTAYCTKNSTYEVYASDLHHNPLFVYQLPVGSLFTTLTDRVTFVASKLAGNQKLLVLSNQRAEISSDNYEEFNKESVLQQFEFSADEKLMSIFPKSFPFYWHEKLENDFSRHPQDTDYKQADNVPSALDIPLSSHTVIDGCIIVTENTVYECRPRVSPERLFLELCINQSDSSLIDQLGISLGLDLNILFERAAEYLLSQGVSKQATRLFHMSKGSPLLRVASFSKYGYIHEILPYIQQLLRKDESDISGADQHRLVELGLHGLVYRLTLEQDNTEIIQMFRKFVQDYTDYEEVQKLTVHLLTEAGLLDILFDFAMARGLVIEALQSLADHSLYQLPDTTLTSLLDRGFGGHLAQVAAGAFLHLLATPHLIHIFCERPQLVSQYPDLLLGNLSDLDSSQLLEVAEGLDPSRPLIRGLIHRRLHSRHRTSSLISFTSSGDFGDAATNRGPYNQGDVRSGDAGRLVHCFLMIVLHLNKKRAQSGEPVNLDFLFTDIPEYLETLVSSQLQGPRKISCGPMPVGAGQTHGAAVLRNGDVYTWGKNNNGRLGHGDQKASSLSSGPGRVGTLATLQIRVTSVACGMNHTLALTQQGVYGWGWSKYGQVGLGTTHVYTRPMLIDSLTGVHCVAVDCGQYHSLALTDEAKVYSWGWGVHGQLGHGDTEEQLVPKCVSDLENQTIVKVAGGYCHSLVLNSKGEVYVFGSSFFGQLGQGNSVKHARPVKVSLIPDKVITMATKFFHSVAVTAKNTVYQWGSHPHGLRHFIHSQRRARQAGKPAFQEADAHLRPQRVDTSYVHGKIKQVVCGSFHSCLLTKNGEVYTWGRNLDGQLGNGTRQDIMVPQMVTSINDRHISHLVAGGEFNIAMDTDSQLFVWGRNEFCQLGLQPGDVKQTTKVIRVTGGSKSTGSELTEMLVPAPLNLVPNTPSSSLSPWQHRAHTDNVSLLSWTEDEDDEEVTSLQLPNLQEVGPSLYDRMVIPILVKSLSSLCDLKKLLHEAVGMKDWATAASLCKDQHSYTQACSFHLMALREQQDGSNVEEFTSRSLHVIGYYGNLLEDCAISSLDEDWKQLIYLVLYHWQMESLLVPMLETFFSDRLPDFDVILATILFRKPDADKDTCEDPTLYQPSQTFLCQFSTSFCLKLSSNVLHKISTGDPRFMSSSALSAIKQLGGGSFDTIQKSMLEGDRLSYDHLWQDIIQNLEKGRDTRNYIYITHSELDRLCEQLSDTDQGEVTPAVFFTCGHYFTKQSFVNEIEKLNIESFVGGFRLPETLSVIKEYYGRKSCMPLACPKCVLGAILSIL